MKNQDIWTEVQTEMREYKAEFPYWPEHVVSQVAYVQHPMNDLFDLAINEKYLGKPRDEVGMRKAAIRTIAASIRFLENLKPKKQDTENATSNLSGAEHSSGQAG
jgi:hypothetical protein